MSNKQEPKPMKEPMKPHGDKIEVDEGATSPEQAPDDDTARVGGAAYAPHDLEADELAEKGADTGRSTRNSARKKSATLLS
jgi:hypothetical protein